MQAAALLHQVQPVIDAVVFVEVNGAFSLARVPLETTEGLEVVI